MSRIQVTIDTLALRGLDPLERQALLDGLQAELARLLADPQTRAAWARSRRTPVLKLGRLPMERGSAGGRKFGSRLAAAIGKGLRA